jgi:PAS domain S-box-containing protein
MKSRKRSSQPTTNQAPEPISSEHARNILDSIAAGVFTVDKDMKITYFNPTAEKITGVPAQEAIGQYCSDVCRANICEKNCALERSIRTDKETVDQHVNILAANGKQIPISITAAALKDEQGNIVGGVESLRDLSTVEALRKELRQSYTFEDIVSKNHLMLRIFDILPDIAESESTILIQGSSGSGKELIARAIHNLSTRTGGPFVPVNCGALPDTLLESELFGYVKGAFTDAKKDKKGRFALAEHGTIFLDEVESISAATQVKLLRVLQEKEFQPLGATAPMKADVRVVAATKDDLVNLVDVDKFRDDLYYRLNVVKIELPPLAKRRDDIPLLVEHFCDKFSRKMERNIARVSDDVLETLMRIDLPGNVRQLENIIEHAFVMCRGEEIRLEHLPPEIVQAAPIPKHASRIEGTLQHAELDALREALERHNWNKIETAKELGLSRTTLWRKMKRLGLG